MQWKREGILKKHVAGHSERAKGAEPLLGGSGVPSLPRSGAVPAWEQTLLLSLEGG